MSVIARRAVGSRSGRAGAASTRGGELGEHDAQLHQRERGAEAAADAAAERDPRVGPALRIRPEEALGPERRRVRVDVGAPVHEVDRRRHHGPGGQVDAGDRRRPLQVAQRRPAAPDAAAAPPSPPPRRTPRPRRAARPSRPASASSRSTVQLSAVAVVSCPATSSVTSSSRSSWSVIGAPSSSRARRAGARARRRPAPRGARRSARAAARRPARASARTAAPARPGRGPDVVMASSDAAAEHAREHRAQPVAQLVEPRGARPRRRRSRAARRRA